MIRCKESLLHESDSMSCCAKDLIQIAGEKEKSCKLDGVAVRLHILFCIMLFKHNNFNCVR